MAVELAVARGRAWRSLTFVPLALVGLGAALSSGRYIALAGLLGTVLATVTVYCTAMIYASLKSVDAWHTPLTPVCYLLFAGVGRACLLASFLRRRAGGG